MFLCPVAQLRLNPAWRDSLGKFIGLLSIMKLNYYHAHISSKIEVVPPGMRKLEIRKETILDSLVREFVKTAEPVSSQYLAGKADLAVSSATVRNELAELETEGFLVQPHTSAGRVPTEAAYKYFVEYLSHPKKIDDAFAGRGSSFYGDRDGAKAAAKALAAITKECVFVLFEPRDTYYTGLSNLFSQPEFGEREIAVNISGALDQLDDAVSKLKQSDEVKTLIGRDCPLDHRSSIVYAQAGKRIVGVVGLVRMDYEKIIGLLDSINSGK